MCWANPRGESVDKPHSHLLLTWRERWVLAKPLTPSFSRGFSHVMAQSIPIPSLPPPSYGQSSSPGKGDFSDNNVLVDLTKRVGQSTSVRCLTHLARYTIMHVVTWIVHTPPRAWIRTEPEQYATFPKSARRRISDLTLGCMVILYTL